MTTRRNGTANGTANGAPPRAPGATRPGGRPVVTSLYNRVTRRLRAAGTLFGDNIKLVLRQLDQEHWSLLQLPYCLVVPTVTRPQHLRPQDADYDSIINPRSITFIVQLDGRGSEAEHLAADDIELAEKQLIGALVNWRPEQHYRPTTYGGMKLIASRAPDVKVSFVFVFYEELVMPDADIDDADVVEMGDIVVHVSDPCCACPPPEPPPPLAPGISVTGGGCGCPEDPCPPEPCISPVEAAFAGGADESDDV